MDLEIILEIFLEISLEILVFRNFQTYFRNYFQACFQMELWSDYSYSKTYHVSEASDDSRLRGVLYSRGQACRASQQSNPRGQKMDET
jgi:hypothetical protein